MGPVNTVAFDKVMSYVAIGKEEGKNRKEGDDSKGWFIQPTIVADVAEDARLMKEEIFGPVVAFAKDFDHALANNTEYGLTGAVANNRDHIEKHVKTSTVTYTSTVDVLVQS